MATARKTRRGEGPCFGFPPGRPLERRYTIGEFIGAGYEGEVYHLTESSTGIERVVKFFYPDRYSEPRRPIRLARKFHRLRQCSVLLQYHHYGEMSWQRQKVGYLVSELAPGRMLHELLQDQPGKRFHPFEALHLVQSVARGVAEIHALRGYHGDIHEDNILVERVGLGFRVKLIDLYLHPNGSKDGRREDAANIVYLLYDLIGGPRGYSRAPRIVKDVVCGRRLAAIYRKFPHAGALSEFLESYPWSDDA